MGWSSWVRSIALGVLITAAVVAAGCATILSTPPRTAAGAQPVLQVVAAENFWGSLAAQLGGAHAAVRSIVSDPNADPHEYEANTADARAVSDADYVVLNGIGYDDWAAKLVAAGAANERRRVLTVGSLLRLAAGANPHVWYDPDAVGRVADQITSDYEQVDPTDALYFREQRRLLELALGPYHQRISAIRAAFGHQPVGATESIFFYLAKALDLRLISPPAFLEATAEGNDPPVASVHQFQLQLAHHQIKVLVYNKQTATAVTTNLQKLAARSGIPVVGISETMQPASTRFEDWQVTQLDALQQALAGASERR